MKLVSNNRFLAKDQEKADNANKFIGQGTAGSSTEDYRKSYGQKANCGNYDSGDVVFISTNGNRPGRIPFDKAEVALAIKAQAILITDKVHHRNRPYNIGEREVAKFLQEHGYMEVGGIGYWIPTA